jgi:hypothetical protein
MSDAGGVSRECCGEPVAFVMTAKELGGFLGGPDIQDQVPEFFIEAWNGYIEIRPAVMEYTEVEILLSPIGDHIECIFPPGIASPPRMLRLPNVEPCTE